MHEVFDIVNCDVNKENQRKLIQLIESGQGVLFVGSGISRRLGYPTWEGLLKELLQLVPTSENNYIIEKIINNGELLHAAEIIKSKINKDLYKSNFETIFGPKNPPYDEFHKLLVSIKFKGFVTTNYDSIIESALKSIQNPLSDYGIVITETDKSNVHYFLNSLVNVNYAERFQLYLHGKYSNYSSLVLTYGDYIEKYDGLDIRKQSAYKKLISSNIDTINFEKNFEIDRRTFRTLHYKAIYPLFVTQRLVFVGFGLRDEYLNKIINDIQNDFNPLQPNHLALISKNVAKSWTRLDYLT